MLNGFDSIAGMYDALARAVYGRAIRESQWQFLNRIPPQANVLILGGGTGWLLASILKTKPECKVCYIEASSKMLERSSVQAGITSRVTFVHGTEADIPGDLKFDVVITHFYLDLFSDEKLEGVIRKIKSSLTRTALWLVTDFVNEGKWWQRLLLALMYKFFTVTCRIDAQCLPNYEGALYQENLRAIDSRKFFGGFIKAGLFRCSLV